MSNLLQEIPGGLTYQSGGILPDSSPLRSGYNTPHRSSNPNSSPSANSFNFTPTYGRRLYPILDPPTITHLKSSPGTIPDNLADESYVNKENSSFINAMDSLQQQMFSSNISNKVLNEFHSRYDQVRHDNITNLENLNNTTSNEELNRRASGRFSRDHRSRFNRMDSISLHYAAKRAEQKEKEKAKQMGPHRKLVTSNNPIEKENMPNDKRLQFQLLESASKRLKMIDGNFKEIDSSPTKTLQEKQDLKNYYQVKKENTVRSSIPVIAPLKPPTLEKKEKGVPTYLLPTKASIKKSTSSNQISPSRCTPNLKGDSYNRHPSPSKYSFNTQSRDTTRASFVGSLKQSPSKVSLANVLNTSQSQLKKSPSISPSKLSPSKISPSKASSNLNAILKGENPASSTTSTISRSKTAHNFNSTSGSIRSSIPTSISSRSFSSTTISGSSSIPRLVSLANSEKTKKKGWQY